MLVLVHNPLAHMQNVAFDAEGELVVLDQLGTASVSERIAAHLCDYPGSVWQRLGDDCKLPPDSDSKAQHVIDCVVSALPMAQTEAVSPEQSGGISPISVPIIKIDGQSVSAIGPVDVVEYPNVPGVDQNWPDPTEDMTVEYLRKMAQAYDIQVHPATKQKKLCELILKEMYKE
jgi:hypothetical protein